MSLKSLKSKVTHSLNLLVNDWQCHVLSCPGQQKTKPNCIAFHSFSTISSYKCAGNTSVCLMKSRFWTNEKLSLMVAWSSSVSIFCLKIALLYKELSSSIFQSYQSVSQSVRHPCHLTKSPLCAIYKGTKALYWPSIINYQLLPPHSDPVHGFMIS